MNDRTVIHPPLWQCGALELHEAFLQGSATPVQALHSCRERIAQVQPRLNAFVALRLDEAEKEAQQSTLRYRQGRPLSVLDGVPVSIKDNLLTADLPTTWGSRGLAQYAAAHDELAVQRLREAGAIVVGKTNVPEFTLEGYTDNPLFGVTRNPWNTELTPGGSSGGAAASVAAGCTPIALGTDGGGSTRRPAAHCGLVGLKPTIGTVARVHSLPTLLLDFEVVGLFARSSADVAALLSIVGKPHDADPASWAAHGRRNAASDKPASTTRMLFAPTLGNAPVDSSIAHACKDAVTRMAASGTVILEQGTLPLDLDGINAAWPTIGQIGLAHLFAAHPSWGEDASPKYREMARQGNAASAAQLWQSLELVSRLRRDCAALFEQWDVIAMPCTAAQPWPAQEPYPPLINGVAVGPRGHAAFTGWVNAAGLPALSVPVAPDKNGLPIGLQLIAKPGAEALLLDLSAKFEALDAAAQKRWPMLA